MAFLNENQIGNMVKIALQEVADFTGDIKDYEFKFFREFHKKVFVTKLISLINTSPYYDRSGNTDNDRYYDITLTTNIIDSWNTIADCIDYIYDNHTVKKRNPNKIQLK
ncbi:MAG: hypothetical protein ACERKD_09140 [Prolixibacteraceae bacterium]